MVGEGKRLTEHNIERPVSRAHHRITRTVANGELRRLNEGGGVEPAAGGALGVRQGRIQQTVGPLNAESGESIQIGGLGDRRRAAGLGPRDAGELPAATKAATAEG